jgi:hypothetical protein
VTLLVSSRWWASEMRDLYHLSESLGRRRRWCDLRCAYQSLREYKQIARALRSCITSKVGRVPMEKKAQSGERASACRPSTVTRWMHPCGGSRSIKDQPTWCAHCLLSGSFLLARSAHDTKYVLECIPTGLRRLFVIWFVTCSFQPANLAPVLDGLLRLKLKLWIFFTCSLSWKKILVGRKRNCLKYWVSLAILHETIVWSNKSRSVQNHWGGLGLAEIDLVHWQIKI